MRIAISGSAGTGKTTLAEAFARDRQAVLIPEGYDRLFDSPGKVKRPKDRLKSIIEDLVRDKHRAECAAPASVSDRCPVDAFNLWLSWGFGKDREATRRFYELCRQCMRHFDLLVVMPFGALPLRQREDNSDPRRRHMNPWVQFHNHSTIIGIARQWVRPEKILPIPPAARDLTVRVGLLRKRLPRAADASVRPSNERNLRD